MPATAAFLNPCSGMSSQTRCHLYRLRGLEDLCAPSPLWDPGGESRASKRGNTKRSQAAGQSLVNLLCAAVAEAATAALAEA